MATLAGKVIAIACTGSNDDREIAVVLAEAGAHVALGTIARTQEQEFSTASIANEVWAIGREQFNSILDSADPAAAAAFAAEVCDRLGRCDAVVVAPAAAPQVPFDELSRDEWDAMQLPGITAPVVLTHAFAAILERGGGGSIIIVNDAASHIDVAGSVLSEARRALGAYAGIALSDRGVRVVVVGREGAANQVMKVLGEAT